MTYDALRKIALSFPGVEESSSYGTAALKWKKKLLIRLKEDGVTMVAVVGFDNRDMLMQVDPETFFSTPHYDGYPSVLVRLARIKAAQARDIVAMTLAHRTST